MNWKRLKRTKSAEVRFVRFAVGFIRSAVGRFVCPLADCKEIARKNSRETAEKQETENLTKLNISGGDNETETRRKREAKQRKNRERIPKRGAFSPRLSAAGQSSDKFGLKKRKWKTWGNLIS